MRSTRDAFSGWREADARHFTGTARVRRMEAETGPGAVKLFEVTFAPGARTHWHRHTGVQVLVVTAGQCRLQVHGQSRHELHAGESAVIAPGEVHWHGASPHEAMTHVAVNVETTTEWMGPVTADDYDGPSAPGGGRADGARGNEPPDRK